MKSTAIEQFHNDAHAALIAGIPLSGGPKNRLTSSKLKQLQQQLESQQPSSEPTNESLETSIADSDSFPVWYRSALSVWHQTGSMLPVLEGLSVRPLAIRESSRALRWTCIYLLIVAATALAGLCFFQIGAIGSIEDLRADLTLPAAIEEVQRFDVLPWVPGVISILSVAVGMGMVGMLAGGLSRFAMLLGGRRYVNGAISTTIVRIAQSLVESGMSVDEAVALGCDLTGAESRISSDVKFMVQGVTQTEAIGRVADCLNLTTSKSLAHLKFAIPVVMVSLVGGGLTLVYCLILYWPILSLIKDLPSAGV